MQWGRAASASASESESESASALPALSSLANLTFSLTNFFLLVCGIQHVKLQDKDKDSKDNEWLLTGIIPVSGDLNGKQTGATIALLKPDADDGKSGLRVHMKGGSWGDVGDLDALVDFVCVADEKDEALEYVSWDLHTLKLNWKTKLACAQSDSEPPKDPKDGEDKDKDPKNPNEPPKDGGNDPNASSSGWGWFTWLFVVVALGSAVYIVGSAWVNYNRYGHIGLDTNHTEFLREIPFLLKDFVRKVAGTFSGGNNRGGYSAV